MPEPPPAQGSAAPTPAGEAQGVLEGGGHTMGTINLMSG